MQYGTSLGQWAAPQGLAALYRAAPKVLVISMRGVVEGAPGATLASALRDALAQDEGGATFWDLELMTSYATDVRTVCTRTLLDFRDRVTICAFAKSALVRMGVSVANIALGGRVEAVKTREEFEAKLRDAVREASRR